MSIPQLAVCALAACAFVAGAQAADVKIYGKIDTGIVYTLWGFPFERFAENGIRPELRDSCRY